MFDHKGPFAFVTTCESVESIEASLLHRLLLAYYRILQANRPLPHSLYWPLTPLSKLFLTPHPDTGVRLLAIRCYALQSGMGEVDREKLEKQVLGETCGIDCQVECGQDIDGTIKEFDGWLLPVLEIKRITDARNALITDLQDFYSVEDGPSVTPSDLW
jgi:midasin